MSLNTFTLTAIKRVGTSFKASFNFADDLDTSEPIRSVGGPSLTGASAVDEDGAIANIIETITIASQVITLFITLPTAEHTYHITCKAEGATSGLVEPQTMRVASRVLQPF